MGGGGGTAMMTLHILIFINRDSTERFNLWSMQRNVVIGQLFLMLNHIQKEWWLYC